MTTTIIDEGKLTATPIPSSISPPPPPQIPVLPLQLFLFNRRSLCSLNLRKLRLCDFSHSSVTFIRSLGRLIGRSLLFLFHFTSVPFSPRGDADMHECACINNHYHQKNLRIYTAHSYIHTYTQTKNCEFIHTNHVHILCLQAYSIVCTPHIKSHIVIFRVWFWFNFNAWICQWWEEWWGWWVFPS